MADNLGLTNSYKLDFYKSIVDTAKIFKPGLHSIIGAGSSAAMGADPLAGATGALVASGLSGVNAGPIELSNFAAPIAAAVTMARGGEAIDMIASANVAMAVKTYNDDLHPEHDKLEVKALKEKAEEARKVEEKISALSDEEIRVKGEELTDSWKGIYFKRLLSADEKALLGEYNRRFRSSYETANREMLENAVPIHVKAAVNLVLPEQQQLGVQLSDIVEGQVGSSRALASVNLSKKPDGGSNIVSAGVSTTVSKVEANTASSSQQKMQIIRGKDGKIIGVANTQEHHIVHQTLKKHPLWKASGMNVEDTSNKMLLPTIEGTKYTTTSRTVHQGRHKDTIRLELEEKMNRILEVGKKKNYSQADYKRELEKIMLEEKSALKSGTRVLNKAEDFRKLGDK